MVVLLFSSPPFVCFVGRYKQHVLMLCRQVQTGTNRYKQVQTGTNRYKQHVLMELCLFAHVDSQWCCVDYRKVRNSEFPGRGYSLYYGIHVCAAQMPLFLAIFLSLSEEKNFIFSLCAPIKPDNSLFHRTGNFIMKTFHPGLPYTYRY